MRWVYGLGPKVVEISTTSSQLESWNNTHNLEHCKMPLYTAIFMSNTFVLYVLLEDAIYDCLEPLADEFNLVVISGLPSSLS